MKSNFKKMAIIFITSIFCVTLILFIIKILAKLVPSQSNNMVFELTSIDFGKFYLAFSIVSSSLIVFFSIVQEFIFKQLLSRRALIIFNIFWIKFVFSLSFLIPMILVLTSEQFQIATSFLSFIAIFSFIIPKEFINKFIDDK